MLVEFKVGNYLSFKEVQTLRMAPIQESGQVGTSFGEVADIMLIYGANGSGKSNFVKAIDFARSCILSGFINFFSYDFGKKDPYFEFVISIDNNTYSYGFEIDSKKIMIKSEWLYILREEVDECLFESDDLYSDSYNKILIGKPIGILKNVEDDNPISVHAKKILRWFEQSIFIENSRLSSEVIPVSKGIITFLYENLKRFDTGILDVIEVPFTKSEIPSNLIRHIPNRFIMDSDGDYMVIVNGGGIKRSWLIHVKKIKGDSYFREVRFLHEKCHETTIENESLGTVRIIQTLALYSMVLSNEERGKDGIIIIDEFECSVHTLVVREFIDLFREMGF